MELGHLEGETEEMADVCRGDYDDEGSSDMVIVVFFSPQCSSYFML